MIGNQLSVLAREVIDPLVDRAKRARTTLFIEVTAKTLWTTAGAGPDVFREFTLLALEFCRHGESPPARRAGTFKCDLRAGPKL
jgi:hypothetical protein